MDKSSPELWLCLGIAFVSFYGGIRGLKKSMKVREMTRFDMYDRGGALNALIMAIFVATVIFIPKRHALAATLAYLALMAIHALYWIMRIIVFTRREIRRNRQAQADINGAPKGVAGCGAQGAPSGER